MVRSTQRGPVPTGRNTIRTADPILRQLFVIAHRKKMTMTELADKTDRSVVTLSNWKHGKHTPTMLDVVILAEAVGCDIVVQEKEKPAA